MLRLREYSSTHPPPKVGIWKWLDALVNKPKFKDVQVRVRVATRRGHSREATYQKDEAVVKDRGNAYKGHGVSEQDMCCTSNHSCNQTGPGSRNEPPWSVSCLSGVAR